MGREGSDLSLLPRKGAGRDQRSWVRGRGQRPGQQAPGKQGQANTDSVKANGAFSGRLRIKMLCSPQAQGHKWLTKGPKNLIVAWIKEGRGGRERKRQRRWSNGGDGAYEQLRERDKLSCGPSETAKGRTGVHRKSRPPGDMCKGFTEDGQWAGP